MASRYVTRDLPAFLENYSPLRQIEDGLSHGLTDGRSPVLVTKKEAPRSRSSLKAPLLMSGGESNYTENATWLCC